MKNIFSAFTLKSIFPVFIMLGIFIAAEWTPSVGDIFIKDGEARMGRPASPGSAGGVHRRTRRRVHRRNVATGTRVTVLPAGCTTEIRGGQKYHLCSGVYYRPYYEGSTVVYEVVEP
jgi:hypothetical protein